MSTLLYVEDEQWRFASLIRMLSNEFTVVSARDADQALAVLQAQGKDAESPTIDIILLDISLPTSKRIPDSNWGKTSGINFARFVLKELKYDIPIVCYTARNNAQIHEELLDDIGVKEVISKSKSMLEVRDILKKYVG